MDLSAAIEAIQNLAVQAAGVEKSAAVIKLPDEPAGTYGLLIPNDDGGVAFQKVFADPPPRKHALLSVDQVGEFVTDVEERIACLPVVWYGPTAVIVVMNDQREANRVGRATVQLVPTPQFAKLRELEKGVKFGQKQFVRLLRCELADCMNDGLAPLLRAVKTLNFSAGVKGSGRIDHGQESLGREIEASVTSTAGPIPDEVVLSVRIYNDPVMKVRRPVKCMIEVDAAENTLCLQPLPGQLDDAIQAEMEHLGTLLHSVVKRPVFFGTP